MQLVQEPTAERLPPRAFQTRRLLAGALQVGTLIGVLVLVAALAPGLGEVRGLLADASLSWIAIAVGLQLLSCLSYVLMFRPIFCHDRSWGTANRIGWSALGMGSIVPASGAAGLALGGWALIQDGVEPERVARRSVAFFLIKGSVNFVAVAVLGTAMAIGLFGPPVSLWLTAFPAALAVLAIAAVLLLPRLGEGTPAPADAGRVRRGAATARSSIVTGTREAIEILRARDPLVIVGALGYWVFDNAVLWAAFNAFGAHVDISIILLGYLVGQLGGLLPIPGGVGGIDGGLIGTLVVFGAPAAATAAAVLVYRVILFWLPLIGGAIGFVALRRSLAGPKPVTRHAARPRVVRERAAVGVGVAQRAA
ncbi:flippase-like domain-containing protein [Conexibacter woesei]|uniref:Integral membrane protein-like protein n=1 Tax=Conexibacter woesei (strain DSM 14684 / CCUG 47730 / CIP 108061 / JCM 11494 / NBRC 100937 / ID131577) TaxID=469383 RepID=D3FB25_CONWI|nr:flippase-like domain-containing protein [Conexibacter woesei]ADB53217.1 conserved hypothetical protein [Conexibacter woesei DSM 14684]